MAERKLQASESPSQARPADQPLFRRSTIAWLIAGMLFVLGGGNFATLMIQKWAEGRFHTKVDRPRAWPFSVISPHIPTWQELLTAAAAAGFFYLSRRYLARTSFRPVRVVLVGLVLVIGTNLVQGWQNGLITPVSGTIAQWTAGMNNMLHRTVRARILPQDTADSRQPIQYYHDAVEVTDAGTFLRTFNRIQPELKNHSQTHPPGAVLVFYGLKRLVGSPAAISLAIAIVSTVLSGLFFYGLLRRLQVTDSLAGYMTLLLLLLPAVQIYYAASLDALVATALLGALCFFLQPRALVAIAGTTILLIAASFLTFGWIFLLPVLAGWELLERRWPYRLVAVGIAIALFYVGLQSVTGFDYLRSFRLASALENPNGLYLLAEPVSYLLTRLECLTEILAFFGPFLVVLLGRGLRRNDETVGLAPAVALHGREQPGDGTRDAHDLQSQGRLAQGLFWLGVGTLLAMFASGAFRTGETARACLFIYPYLLLPIAMYLQRPEIHDRARTQLLSLVFLQTLAMQTIASFFW